MAKRLRGGPSQEGFTLVEAMIAGAVGIIITLGMSNYLTNQHKAIVGIRALASRDMLISNLNRFAGNGGGALVRSLAFDGTASTPGFPSNVTGNANFQNCLNGQGGATGCQATSTGFTMTDPNGVPVAGPDPAHAAVYTTDGALCGNASTSGVVSDSCPVIAYTSMTPVCPGGTASCAQARVITVTYTVKQAPRTTLPAGFLKTMTHGVFNDVPLSGASGQLSALTCPTGTYLQGVDPSGNAICQPLAPLVCSSLGGVYNSASSPPCALPSQAPAAASPPGPVCTANSTQSCTVANGTGTQTCASDGSGWGPCANIVCNSGYNNFSGMVRTITGVTSTGSNACGQCPSTVGAYQLNSTGACIADVCAPGGHFDCPDPSGSGTGFFGDCINGAYWTCRPIN